MVLYLHLYRFKWVLLKGVSMEIKVGGSKQKVRDVDTKTLLGYIEISGVKWGSGSIGSSGSNRMGGKVKMSRSRGGTASSLSEYLIDKWWMPKDIKFKYASNKQYGHLSVEMGRTRSLERSINKHIPNKIKSLQEEIKYLDKKSPHYNRSHMSKRRQIKEKRLQLKEYKYELKYRKRIVYNLSKSIIPALYIIRREKYNSVQCKWRFMGREQPRIHLGTFKDVGGWDDEKLKKRAVTIIQGKFVAPLDTLTRSWIKSENAKLEKWCKEMNYRVYRD